MRITFIATIDFVLLSALVFCVFGAPPNERHSATFAAITIALCLFAAQYRVYSRQRKLPVMTDRSRMPANAE